jgi:hypothetical protein
VLRVLLMGVCTGKAAPEARLMVGEPVIAMREKRASDASAVADERSVALALVRSENTRIVKAPAASLRELLVYASSGHDAIAAPNRSEQASRSNGAGCRFHGIGEGWRADR